MQLSERERLVLRELSENSRASLSTIAKRIGYSYVTAGKIVEKLKAELGIRFTLEFDLDKLGFEQVHVMAVKFARKPDLDALTSTLRKDDKVQAAYLTEGQFDLLLFVTESDPIRYIYWETTALGRLSDYGAAVKPSQMPYMSLGFLPVISPALDYAKLKLKSENLELLKLLNENSRLSYSTLSKQLRMSESTIRYKVFKLHESGIIKRFTIAVQRPPQSYIFCFFENWRFTRAYEQSAAIDREDMMNADKGIPALTRFQISAPVTGSYANLRIALCESRSEAVNVILKRAKYVYRNEGYETQHAQIVKPLKGLYPFRNIDVRTGYNVVRWE